ncbi:MAG TPA: DUF488 domain-containing protein [Bacteroidales bacterium]|nr:DUF488 domain-containing protein [Bacteroidales bacterium]
MQQKNIWTIGHSTRTMDEFIQMLESFQIEVVADIRSYPGSKRYPHFNKEALAVSLPEKGIAYIHLKELGGRRKVSVNSHNTAWKDVAFRGYADYMETGEFLTAVTALEQLAGKKRVAFMCAEALWWRCHRALVSDFLKHQGWMVTHIIDIGKGEEHPYTSPAKIIGGKLAYGKK